MHAKLGLQDPRVDPRATGPWWMLPALACTLFPKWREKWHCIHKTDEIMTYRYVWTPAKSRSSDVALDHHIHLTDDVISNHPILSDVSHEKQHHQQTNNNKRHHQQQATTKQTCRWEIRTSVALNASTSVTQVSGRPGMSSHIMCCVCYAYIFYIL